MHTYTKEKKQNRISTHREVNNHKWTSICLADNLATPPQIPQLCNDCPLQHMMSSPSEETAMPVVSCLRSERRHPPARQSRRPEGIPVVVGKDYKERKTHHTASRPHRLAVQR
ncbi:hypothetical protein ABVT39_014226 [Epinephelus coioides]